MIDLLRLQIPINENFWLPHYDKETGKLSGGFFNPATAMDYGFSLVGSISNNDNAQEVNDLRCPFESLPSHNSSLAFKIYKGERNYFPHLELKASPAKLLQGHNVYGSDDLKLCADALLMCFVMAYPKATVLFDFRPEVINVKQIDCTYSARLKNESQIKQSLLHLGNISNGHIRPATNQYDTTVMYNPSSDHIVRKIYAKSPELARQVEKLRKKSKKCATAKRQLKLIEESGCETYAKNLLRFEASIKDRKLKTFGFKTDLTSMIALDQQHKTDTTFTYKLWWDSFKPLFDTFEGFNMNIHDDEKIQDQLNELFKKPLKPCSKTGESRFSYAKPSRLFNFYRLIKTTGYNEVKRTTDRMTFWRNISDLSEVVSKSQLMNFNTQESNVVPLVQIINVDFNHQLPDNWSEPKPMYEQLMRAS